MADHANPLLALALVRNAHQPRAFANDHGGYQVCGECRQAWPCHTERLINGADELGLPSPVPPAPRPVDPAQSAPVGPTPRIAPRRRKAKK